MAERKEGGFVKVLFLAFLMLFCYGAGVQVSKDRILVKEVTTVQETFVPGFVNMHTGILVKDWQQVMHKDSLVRVEDVDSCLAARHAEVGDIVKKRKLIIKQRKQSNR